MTLGILLPTRGRPGNLYRFLEATVLTAVDSVHTINPTRRLRVITIIGLAIVWFVIAKSISASAVSTVFT